MLTTQQVVDQAAQAVKERQPWSLVRLGDGDAILLAYPDRYDKQLFDHVLRYAFGPAPLTVDDVAVLRFAVERAYRNASVIGIAQNGEKGGRWDVAHEWATATGLLDGKPLCNVDIASELHRGGHFDAILRHAKTVCLVTCRDVEQQFAARFPWLDTVHRIDVPHEYQAEPGRAYTERHWPEGYWRIMDEIQRTPAGVYLVGAGSPGKVYAVHAAQQHGAVALEIGSLFDGWAGMTHTRSYLRNAPGVHRL